MIRASAKRKVLQASWVNGSINHVHQTTHAAEGWISAPGVPHDRFFFPWSGTLSLHRRTLLGNERQVMLDMHHCLEHQLP